MVIAIIEAPSFFHERYQSIEAHTPAPVVIVTEDTRDLHHEGLWAIHDPGDLWATGAESHGELSVVVRLT
jgi:hypothetical protein